MSAPGSGLPRLHVTDDPRHGVTQYARRLAMALGSGPAEAGRTPAGRRPGEPAQAARTAAALTDEALPEGVLAAAAVTGPVAAESVERVHVHFTDRLWGADPAAAATAFERLAASSAVTVTLHDLPQPSDGARGLERRAACYRRVVAAAAGVVVNSRHEATLLTRFVAPQAEVAVIPLPVDPQPVPAVHALSAGETTAADGSAHPVPVVATPTVAVLGFVYPGKGHARVISAAGYLARRGSARVRPTVEALGRASDGHERDLDLLTARAGRAGVEFTVSGFLGEAVLLERCRGASVPVIAHEHVSASGSLATWLGAGRRPIVLRSPYMEEMAELHRGALTLVEPQWLPGALEHALAHPESTWLDRAVRLGPGTAEVAGLYRRFWAEVAW